MGRCPCCDKTKVKRGLWSPDEDTILKNYIQRYGTGGNWIALPHKAGLRRCGKSCRLRWLNYLRPDIKHGGFTEEEDNIILTLHHNIGSRWSVIASHLAGRTDNEVKNYWNTKLKKKKLQRDAGNPNHSSTTNTFFNTCNTMGTSNIVSSSAFATDHHQLNRSASTYNNNNNNNGNSSSDCYSGWSSNGVLQQQLTNTGYYHHQQDLAPQLIHEVSAEEPGNEPSAPCSSGGVTVLVEPSQPVSSHFPLENKYGSSTANGGGEIDHDGVDDSYIDRFLMDLVGSAGFSIDDLLNGLI